VAAARVFAKLCAVAYRVQPYRIENVGLVVDATQVQYICIFKLVESVVNLS